MKKTILILFFALMAFTIHAQETIKMGDGAATVPDEAAVEKAETAKSAKMPLVKLPPPK